MIKVFFGENEYESYQDLQREIVKFPNDTEVKMVEADEISDINKILESSSNMGLFNKPTLTVCKRITKNKSKNLVDKFLEYIIANPELDIYIWEDKELDKRKGFYKDLKKSKIELKEYKNLKKFELDKWVISECKNKKLKLSSAQIGLIIDLVGENQFMLSNELNKLKLFADSNDGELKTKDLKSVLTNSSKSDIWDLLKTIEVGDRKKRQDILEKLLSQGENPMGIFAMLAREFRILIQTRYLIDQGQTLSHVQKELKLHPFVAQKAYQAARGIGYQKLKRYHDKLVSSDLAIKEGRLDAELALNLFVSIL